MAESAIELMDVRKSIGKKEIIKGVSFQIRQGEVFGFIGPNGAGKTTTIRMIVGLMRITSGDIHIMGKSVKTDYRNAVRHVGAIVENPEMYPFMTGEQNLAHYARMIPGINQERIDEAVQIVGLEKALKTKVGKYSLGMRQRLGIAQALLHRPSILILDEPTNGLDPAGIREIRLYIRRLAEQENVAVVISSHLLSEVELMCDRIGIIKNGEMVAIQEVKGSENGETSEANEVIMEVTPPETAMELLVDKHGIKATASNERISFQAEKESIPAIIKTFAENGVSVYQVAVTKETLEDKFFDLIGENTIG